MKRPVTLCGISFGLLSCVSVFSQGTIVFSSFSPGGDYNHNGSSYAGHGIPEAGFPFQPSQSGQLSSISLPLFWNLGPNTGNLLLCRTDLTTRGPGVPLETFAVSNLPVLQPWLTEIQTIPSALHPQLSASEQYWLVLSAAPDTMLLWNVSLDQKDAFYSIQNGLPLIQPNDAGNSGAFNVTVVPEPTTITLLVSGGAFGVFRILRRRATC